MPPPPGEPSSATCSHTADANTDRPPPTAAAAREQQAQLIEVLPAAEYEDEHLPGAINIPLKELDRETTRGLDRGRPVIAYCYDYQ